MIFSSKDVQEGIAAFLEKRPAAFQGRFATVGYLDGVMRSEIDIEALHRAVLEHGATEVTPVVRIDQRASVGLRCIAKRSGPGSIGVEIRRGDGGLLGQFPTQIAYTFVGPLLAGEEVEIRVQPPGARVELLPLHDAMFLEANPTGQWLFLEDRTGQPITRSVAQALVEAENVAALTEVTGTIRPARRAQLAAKLMGAIEAFMQEEARRHGRGEAASVEVKLRPEIRAIEILNTFVKPDAKLLALDWSGTVYPTHAVDLARQAGLENHHRLDGLAAALVLGGDSAGRRGIGRAARGGRSVSASPGCRPS